MGAEADRALAHEWVRSTRRRWDDVLDQLGDGALDLDGLWALADGDPVVAQLKLLVALEARPGARKVLTRRVLGQVGVPESVTLGEVDPHIRDGLRRVFADAAAPDAAAWDGACGTSQGERASAPRAHRGVDVPELGVVVVVSGPGGAGKGTVVERLVAADRSLWLSRSWTTRAKRSGEADDAYRWATEEEFEAHIEAGGFLEWVQFLDYRQGSPVPTPPPGCDVLFEIDVAGARMVRERWPQAICVFIDAPSRAVQEERLRGRGDDDARIVQRLAKAEEEVAAALEMGAHVVINDDLDTTVNELQRLIERARAEAADAPR